MVSQISGARREDAFFPEALTDREIEILALLVDGQSNREIARTLSVALDTVKWYNKRIYEKLGVKNRTQAAAQARTLGLLPPQNGPHPPPSGPRSVPAPIHNLPASVTSFVGRRQEVATLTQLLGTSRLVSVIGPAGVGKTRIALRLAANVASRFPDGVFFVPLASVPGPDGVFQAVADQVMRELRVGDVNSAQVLDALRDKTLFLVLDNFEHLLPAAARITEMLKAAPGVKVLVTSRERLSLYGEVVYRLGGLRLPGWDATGRLRHAESLDLFLQRAGAAVPEWTPNGSSLHDVVRICHLVEGLPLAIELAATWIAMLPARQIAAEIERDLGILAANLRDVPSDQRSMRAAIARSWHLLDAKQRSLFRKLAVFRGGFSQEAAQAIAHADRLTLQALVDKSMLQYDRDTDRYQLHELLRHYAWEQLEAAEEVATTLRIHAAYFADFMEARWPRLQGERQRDALREIQIDMENVRAAWTYWGQQADANQMRRFLHSYWVIHDMYGWYSSGSELFSQAMRALEQRTDTEARLVRGWLLAALGLYRVPTEISSRAGLTQAMEGVELLRELPLCPEMILPWIGLYYTAVQVSEYRLAQEALAQCQNMAAELGDRWALAKAWQLEANLAIRLGRRQQAEQLAREALDVFDACHDNWSKSVVCIELLGNLAVADQRFTEAQAWIEAGLEAARESNFEYPEQMAYWQLGYIEVLQDNYEGAGRYWHRAHRMGERVAGTECFMFFSGVIPLSEWTGRQLIDSP